MRFEVSRYMMVYSVHISHCCEQAEMLLPGSHSENNCVCKNLSTDLQLFEQQGV